MKPWRTVGTLVVFGLMLLASLVLCSKDARPQLVPAVVTGLVTLGIAAAGKSSFEHWTKKGQAAEPAK